MRPQGGHESNFKGLSKTRLLQINISLRPLLRSLRYEYELMITVLPVAVVTRTNRAKTSMPNSPRMYWNNRR